MAKIKEEKTNVMRLLEAAGIPYTPHQIELSKTDRLDGVTAARKLEKPAEMVFKTLVAQDPKGNFFVYVLPVAETLDLKKAARAAGVKSVAMLPQKQLLSKTGYVHGGCSPVGMTKIYPTFFAEEVLLIETMLCSAGKIGYQIEVRPDDLIALTHGQIADLTTE